jgi:RNA polymerase sigma-70 factor (ECF subfamily)
MPDDEPLIKQAQAGDAQAFECLLESHYDTIFRFAFKWCGNRDDAEDIAQQACVKLARGLGQYRFESSFTSWLYRLVINCAKDWQKAQRKHSHSGDDNEQWQHLPYEDQPDKSILMRQLLTALENFSDGMKETVLLVHAEGFTHGEAADILGIEESTISWRIHQIRKKFQSRFGQDKL